MMTKQQKEKLANRLVLNFGVLLSAGLILLYINSAFRSNVSTVNATYRIILIIGIVSLLLGLFLFIWGKMKKPSVKNYSAICLGTLIGSVLLYLSKFNFISWYTRSRAVMTLYIAMVVYFIVLAIITSIQLKKPLVKPEAEKIKHKKKRK